MIENGPVPRNAQPIPAPPPGTPKHEPRTSAIWIRIDGRWLPGHIQCWRRLPNGRWTAWLCFQEDPEHPTIAPVWGHYLYDPEAIVDRARHSQLPGSPTHPRE